VFGVASALMPVLYCGVLAYYFLDISGSVQNVEDNGLGPTEIGLAAIGLVFCIPMILKVIRLFSRPRSPGPDGENGPDAPPPDDQGGFDADAAIARYMAQRAVEATAAPAAAPVTARPAPHNNAPAARPGFGRRGR
jgi:hypothetical protein